MGVSGGVDEFESEFVGHGERVERPGAPAVRRLEVLREFGVPLPGPEGECEGGQPVGVACGGEGVEEGVGGGVVRLRPGCPGKPTPRRRG